MLRNHKPMILNWFKAKGRPSSGAVEGLNLKAKLTIRKAYGFKSLKCLQVALYHTLENLSEPLYHQIKGSADEAFVSRTRTVATQALHYLRGLVQSVRKNVERMTEVVPDSDYQSYSVIRDSGSLLAYANDVECNIVELNGFTTIYRDSILKISLYKAS